MNTLRFRFLLLLAVCLVRGSWTVASEPITRIADVRSLSREEASRARTVQLRGVVTWREGDEFTLQDDTGGTWIHIFAARKHQIWMGDEAVLSQVLEGMELEVEGITHASGFAPAIWPKSVHILGLKPLPPARPLDRVRFFGGVESGQRIEAQGVIMGFQPMGESWRLRMQAGPDIFFVLVSNKVIQNPDSILDAEVRVRGVGASGFNTRREFLAPRILVSIPEDLIVDRAAAPSAFAAPLVALDELRAFHHEPEKPRRLRIQGTVTFVLPGQFFYLQEGDRAVRVESHPNVLLQAGDRVEVVGYVDMTRNIGGLAGADVRKLGRGQLPEPEVITPEKIMGINVRAVNIGQAAQPHDFDGHLIRFRAQLLAVQSAPNGKSSLRRLTLRQGKLTLEAVLNQGDMAALDAMQPGSKLEVTGLVQLEFAIVETHQSRSFLRPVRQGIILRRATDVVVVSAPSWWTATRLMVVLAVVALLLGGALIWAWQMRRQVQRKTHELATEIGARRNAAIEFQATLRERNRLAANLHDTLLQTLGGLSYQLEACEAESLPRTERKANYLDTARRMVERGQSDLRGTVWALRVLPSHGRTITDALCALGHQLGQGHSVKISVEGETGLPTMSDFVAGNLLLVAQEAMHNALEHARPSHVHVKVSARDGGKRVVLTVRNDGLGFQPGTQPGADAGHFGLQGMRERAERLNGSLVIESTVNHGTTVRLEVPLQPFDDDVS